MNIGELKAQLESLLAAGQDPSTPVCFLNIDYWDEEEFEVTESMDVSLYSGPYITDPLPEETGVRHLTGPFLLIQTADRQYVEIPNGHRFTQLEFKKTIPEE